ncbi:MAG: ABC transporter substrate-binding protein [Micropruina sp.]|uniref:ABC transporter substrate-binding protein n=1 Tax=Micropruina sp. TaxID=2737536 RepID=UPI0039E623A8
MRITARRGMAVAAAVTLLAGFGGCAQSQRQSSSPDAGGASGGTKDTFVFAASSDPVMLDPAMASDGETFRIARQQFEGLIGTKPGTTELEPLLATAWKASADNKSFTFTLREGVKFSDGTDFNGEAVCANFDRWFNWTGINQSENITYYYGKLMRGFKTGAKADQALYKSCQSSKATEATINLNSPFVHFLDAMTLPSFSMQSPTAMKKYNADNTTGKESDPRFSEYATAHPTGTGPFVFEKWERGQQVILKRNDNYWGEKAKVSTVIIRTISDAKARTQELQAGNIDGYDLVAPADQPGLKQAGLQILQRPAFNILYLGMNQKIKELSDLKVRQAIAYAIDKDALIKQVMPEGTVAAINFMPENVTGWNGNVEKYAYNPDKAKALLKEAGQENLTLTFNYPTGVSRPYMPSPEDIYTSLKAQLEAVGIKVNPVASKWSPDYLDLIQGDKGTDKHGIHLLGWTGDYNDPDNFIGVFFGTKANEWGFDNQKLFAALKEAREMGDAAAQKAKYEEINKMIADFVPGVPLTHAPPSLAFGKGVQGYQPSPVQDEVWNTITITK